MFGKYWFGYWVQPLLWVSLTQLLRIKTIRKNVLLRILFSFLLIFSIEKYVIMMVAFHRDYLPSSWTMYNDLSISIKLFSDAFSENNNVLIICWNILFDKKQNKNSNRKEINYFMEVTKHRDSLTFSIT